MADSTTANYSWKKPENGASSDTWGIKWNENADDIDSDLKAVENKADACLVKTSNLLDLADKGAARTNLGLGTAATQASSAFDAAGAASTAQSNAINSSCQRASNLSDLTNATTARGYLGLGTAATKNITVSASGPSGGANGDIWVQI
jgi:hypothetical protein